MQCLRRSEGVPPKVLHFAYGAVMRNVHDSFDCLRTLATCRPDMQKRRHRDRRTWSAFVVPMSPGEGRLRADEVAWRLSRPLHPIHVHENQAELVAQPCLAPIGCRASSTPRTSPTSPDPAVMGHEYWVESGEVAGARIVTCFEPTSNSLRNPSSPSPCRGGHRYRRALRRNDP